LAAEDAAELLLQAFLESFVAQRAARAFVFAKRLDLFFRDRAV